MESEVTPKGVIRVLEGCINFLNIEVMAVDLPSSVSMSLEEQVEKMRDLMAKLEKMKGFVSKSAAPVTKPRAPSQKMNTELKAASQKISEFMKNSSNDLKAVSSKVSSTIQDKSGNLKEKVSTKLHNKTDDIKDNNDTVDSSLLLPPTKQETTEDNFYEEFDSVRPPELPASRLQLEETGDEISISSNDTQEDKVKTMLGCSADELKPKALYYGSLRKHKKSRLSFTWDKRLCILCDDLLFYYKPENDKKPIGVIELTGYKLAVPSKGNGFMFNLEGSDKTRATYCLQADSLSDADCWKKHLSAVIGSDKADGIDNFGLTSPADTNSLSTSGESSDTSGGASVADIVVGGENGEIYDDVKQGEEAQKPEINGPGVEEQDFYEDVQKDVPPMIPEEDAIEENEYGDVAESMKQIPPPPVRHISPRSKIVSPPPVVDEFLPKLHARAPLPPPTADGLSPSPVSTPIPPRPTVQHPPILPPPIPTDQGFSIDNIYMGMYDCEAEDNQDLEFKQGDILYIIEKTDTQWWLAFLEGKIGLVPSNHLATAFV